VQSKFDYLARLFQDRELRTHSIYRLYTAYLTPTDSRSNHFLRKSWRCPYYRYL